ncbi:MAG TPA: MBL fold metallo-hydrolase, partial [Syntrophobacteraceae bacterium]|nr:MBL fold metallo-hydrolase [Syntrophobacteraceae bacterium]
RYLGASLETDAWSPAFFLQEGDLVVKGMLFRVIHTPGHSPGSISLYWPEQKALFTGDVIFKDGLGRTDLPGGNGSTLKKSIRKLAELDVECLLPGHGDVILGAEQVRMNFQRVERTWFAYI